MRARMRLTRASGWVIAISVLLLPVAIALGGLLLPTAPRQASRYPQNPQTESGGFQQLPISEQKATEEVSPSGESAAAHGSLKERQSPENGNRRNEPRRKPGTPSEIIDYLRLGDVPYTHVQEELGKESLPVLCKMLENQEYFRDWNRTATAIAYLGEERDSYEAIKLYIQRHDPLERLQNSDRGPLVLGKAMALRLLGLVGGTEGERTLQSMLADTAYTEVLLGNWINDPVLGDAGASRYFALEARGAAALGLVLTRKEANVELVRDMRGRAFGALKKPDAESSRSPEPPGHEITENTVEDQFYIRMVDALAIDGYIRLHGVGKFLDHPEGEETKFELKTLRQQIWEEDGYTK